MFSKLKNGKKDIFLGSHGTEEGREGTKMSKIWSYARVYK